MLWCPCEYALEWVSGSHDVYVHCIHACNVYMRVSLYVVDDFRHNVCWHMRSCLWMDPFTLERTYIVLAYRSYVLTHINNENIPMGRHYHGCGYIHKWWTHTYGQTLSWPRVIFAAILVNNGLDLVASIIGTCRIMLRMIRRDKWDK